MAGKYKLRELEKLREKFRAKQDSLEPYLTFAMMAEIMEVTSPGAVTNVMEKFVELGWAKKVPWGDAGNRYKIL